MVTQTPARRSGGIPNPYRDLLGEAFESLHPHVQRAHVAPLSALGVVDVERGTHWAVPALARYAGTIRLV